MFGTRTTLVKTFSMMERHRPAMMSAGVLPSRCSEITLLVMNTVQRLPSAAGLVDEKAVDAMSLTGILSERAKFSRNEPQPDEHASLTMTSVMTPRSTHIAFMSCPPMSRMNVASGQ